MALPRLQEVCSTHLVDTLYRIRSFLHRAVLVLFVQPQAQGQPCVPESVCHECICWSAVCEDGGHRLSQGTSVAHTDIVKPGMLEDGGADALDAAARNKSKKGRFNVTPASHTAPLHRTSLSTCALPPFVLCKLGETCTMLGQKLLLCAL